MTDIVRAPSLLPELVIDSFAGGGGASEGIQLALGHGDLNRGSIQTGFTTVYETEKKGVVL